MAEEFVLKLITPEGLEAAAARAEHYRLLNQPALAQSICHDILATDPENERALVTLVLALTDEFGSGGSATSAREYASRLSDEYLHHYYHGIIAERQARSMLDRGPAAAFAYDGFREAMEFFEKARAIRPEGNDDAILRWNSCARTIMASNLRPRSPEPELGLE